ncbi:prenyltransferase/squalene oxidase repeat-containing protein [Flexivirga sp. B27]
MTTTLRARAGLTGAIALACAGLTGIAAPAHAATPTVDTGAHFLSGELTAGGDHLSISAGGSSYPDYGLTIDAVLGLDAVQTGQSAAQRAATYITKNSAAYTTGGTEGEQYAGATAKLLVFSQAQGLPTSKIVADLKGLETDNGQFKDKSTYGDYSNTMGQSLAVVGLTRAGQPDTKAVDFLLKQQCDDGGFRITFTGSCTGDTDATSLAVQALSAAGGHDAQIDKAIGFISGKQEANGGVVEPGAENGGPNTNSTGLAAVAFSLAGKTTQAAKAKSYVESLQFGCSAPAELRGGYAFDDKTFAEQRAKGSKATVTDQELRATPQALLAISQQPYLKITAGGSAAAPALDCSAAPAPTPTSSSTGTATASATASSTTTGPAVITDGPSDGGNNGLLFGGVAALGGVALAGAGLRRRLRSND